MRWRQPEPCAVTAARDREGVSDWTFCAAGLNSLAEPAECAVAAHIGAVASAAEGRSEIMATVADQFGKTLAAAGVKRIYGIVGDSLNGLTDASAGKARSNGSMSGTKKFRVRGRRRGASDRQPGRLRGKLRTWQSAFDQWTFRLPSITRPRSRYRGSNPFGGDWFRLFPENHPETLFKECSHYCELVSGAHQMPRTLEVRSARPSGGAAYPWW